MTFLLMLAVSIQGFAEIADAGFLVFGADGEGELLEAKRLDVYRTILQQGPLLLEPTQHVLCWKERLRMECYHPSLQPRLP